MVLLLLKGEALRILEALKAFWCSVQTSPSYEGFLLICCMKSVDTSEYKEQCDSVQGTQEHWVSVQSKEKPHLPGTSSPP